MRPARHTRLLLDIGNTRLKWALLVDGHLSAQRAIAHGGRARVLQQGTLARAIAGADSASCVSVAQPRLTAKVVAALRRAGLRVQRLRSRSLQRGLRNAYREPWRLGADRWAAMLGARSLVRGAVLVVGAGTALTIDLVDAQGGHRGGVIVPGAALMQAVLLARTAGIARRAAGAAGRGRRSGAFGRNTAEALARGAQLAGAALVERLRLEARRELGHYPRLLLTGGDAPALARQLKCAHRYVPDLVLRGLAAVAA